MLELKDIKKDYITGDTVVNALRGISVSFRKNEFVSVLGQSGCGKTTLLNIIGGLDRYTTGDLVINNVSTKEYKDSDWDIYRNNSIGFVFQNYNLIPHQSVLSNVELALTLSGVSKEERRKRAKAVLEKVGLAEQIHKKPNQMSGGQMQRVAIARALVNNPDIILADEPTGALDTTTSVQIMDILKEIAKDKLIIMVTHNSELAEKYSSRIIRLSDGAMVSDSNPYVVSEEEKAEKPKKAKKVSMTFFTALGLSLNNLLTKKGRTILTAFAGSIGIIGIALILSLSTGIQNYISRIEEDTLSSYPLTIQETTVDVSSMVVGLMNEQNKEVEREEGRIYSRDIMNDMLEVMSTELKKNNLKDFKEYLESDRNSARDSINAIQYSYNLKLNLYKQTAENSYIQVNPSQVMNALGMGQMMEQEDSFMSSMGGSSYATNTDVWIELLNNDELLKSQYDLLAGKWPESYNEVMLIATSDNSISDYTLYALGLKNQSELAQKIKDLQEGKTVSGDDQTSYSYDELLNISFKLLLNTDYYQKQGNMWVDQSDNNEYMTKLLNSAEEIKIAGIIRPNEESLIAQTGTGGIGYTSDLEEYVINKINSTEIAEKQKATPETNIFTGMPFAITTGVGTGSAIDYSTLTAEQKTYIQNLSQAELAELMRQYTSNTNATYESNLQKLGIVDITDPSAISIYPSSFKGKEQIEQMIENYNQDKINQGNDEDTIEYTDLVGMMMSSVSSIVDVVSYVLIAFVSISLIVSSIMIGIITYISVLERTKEIGILRSIGASKQDVSRVFNAETFIVGLVSGLIGIGVTLLLCIPINIIIKALVDVSNIAKLPLTGAIILVVISMLLTMFAGLIPSKMASKRDPVEALRSE